MTDISRGTCSHSMYRSNNRSNNHHPEQSQCNVGSRRSMANGFGGNLSSTSRRQFFQRKHSWSIPELVRETGLILEVQREYGRILSQSNFSSPNIHIFFSLSTLVNDAPLSVITDNLTDVFQAGVMVEIEVEGGVNLKELKDHVHVILTCTSIRPSSEIGRKPDLVPMVVIQDDREIPLALIANHELVALPRQVLPIEEVKWPEFATIGRSIEGRILNAPPWIREFTNPAVKKIALSIQRFGRDREGFAVVKEYISRGVILAPIDEEDKKICGDLFFPYEMRIDASRSVTEYEDVYRLGSKWYFRACPELPNRKYRYRVYSLNSLDNVLNDGLITQERSYGQIVNPSVITNQESVTADVSTNVIEAAVSTNHGLDDSHQLIEFDNELVPVSSPDYSFPKAIKVSPVTVNLLSDVNFNASPTAALNDINETVILQSSNSSDIADCNLLIDLDVADEVQQVTAQARHFHVLDEDFTLSSFNFDHEEAKKCSYEAEMFGCSNHENNEKMRMTSQIKEPGNVDLNRVINGFNASKARKFLYLSEPVKMECNNCLIRYEPEKYIKDCATLCNGNSAVEQLIDFNNDSSISSLEVDTSDDDSGNEMFRAVSVERQNDDGVGFVLVLFCVWRFSKRSGVYIGFEYLS
uniref:Tudor domain-containing protein n=1 Tax=Elaeophora elaphi TaxID=1147741 RepID=A0A0R3RHA9_9BILA